MDSYVAAKIAMIGVISQDAGLYRISRNLLDKAESDLKEKLRDLTVDADQ